MTSAPSIHLVHDKTPPRPFRHVGFSQAWCGVNGPGSGLRMPPETTSCIITRRWDLQAAFETLASPSVPVSSGWFLLAEAEAQLVAAAADDEVDPGRALGQVEDQRAALGLVRVDLVAERAFFRQCTMTTLTRRRVVGLSKSLTIVAGFRRR
jgi:hypothetical protein